MKKIALMIPFILTISSPLQAQEDDALFNPNIAVAQKENLTAKFDTVTPDQIMNAFLQAATNKTLWADRPFPSLIPRYIPGKTDEYSIYHPEYLKKHYPWLLPLIHGTRD